MFNELKISNMKKIIILSLLSILILTNNLSARSKGFYSTIEWEGAAYPAVIYDDYTTASVKLMVMTGPKAAVGYQVNTFFSIGAFGGYLFYANQPETLGNGLCGLDLRSHFVKGNISPYINLQMGASMCTTLAYENTLFPILTRQLVSGFYISPKLGCKFKTEANFGLSIYMRV